MVAQEITQTLSA